MAKVNNTPSADFVIHLSGSLIKPWMVPMRSLSRILSAVQRLVDQRDDLEDDEELEATSEAIDPVELTVQGTRTLQLINVKAGSVNYAVSSLNRDATLSILRDTGTSIKKPEDALWHPSTISSLEDLSTVAGQLGVVFEFRPVKDGKMSDDVIAMIRPETAADVRSRAYATGHTSVFGELQGVGGATEMKCRIRVRGRHKLLFCDVANEDLVRELGKYIYSDVLLSGHAVWYRYNNKMKTMKVKSFSPAKTESLLDTAKRLRKIEGGWESVADPETEIRSMRGGV